MAGTSGVRQTRRGTAFHFTGAEQQALTELGLKSILILPIFINETFWGFIGFHDCRRERVWTIGEKNIFSAFASTFGEAIARNSYEQQLQKQGRGGSRNPDEE